MCHKINQYLLLTGGNNLAQPEELSQAFEGRLSGRGLWMGRAGILSVGSLLQSPRGRLGLQEIQHAACRLVQCC